MEITIMPKDMKTKKTTLNTWFLAMGVRKMVGYMVSIIFVKFITNSVLLAGAFAIAGTLQKIFPN